MSFTTSTLRLALLALCAVAGPGCTHFANVAAVPTADGTPTYVSSRSWEDGTPRMIITEKVFERPEAPCDLLEIQREYFDRAGVLEERSTDIEACDVVLSRVAEEYDIDGAQMTRITQLDTDHDGEFDVREMGAEAVNSVQLATLATTQR